MSYPTPTYFCQRQNYEQINQTDKHIDWSSISDLQNYISFLEFACLLRNIRILKQLTPSKLCENLANRVLESTGLSKTSNNSIILCKKEVCVDIQDKIRKDKKRKV